MLRTESFLKSIGAVDISPRYIRKREKVRVICYECNKEESDQTLMILQKKLRLDKTGWRCRLCGFKSGGEKRRKPLVKKEKIIKPPKAKPSKKIRHKDCLVKPINYIDLLLKDPADRKLELDLSAYGLPSSSGNPEARRKILTKKGLTPPEKFIFEMLLMRGYDFRCKEVVFGACRDFIVYNSEGAIILIIDIDSSRGHSSLPYKDCEYLAIDSKKVKEYISAIVALLGADYSLWLRDMYDKCRGSEFPYPVYSKERMESDWQNLCKLDMDVYNDKVMPCNSIVTSFHKSIYFSRCGNSPSPVEAWNNPELLRECIENRFVYRPVLSVQQMARGFERNKLAPRVTVFQPALARYLLSKFSPNAKTCVDPYSGFSGRLLGAASLGVSYVGYDINQSVVSESNDIIKFLGIQDCSVSCCGVENLIDSKEYDVLLSCPPYGDKERWENKHYESVDYYIEMAMKKIKAKIYIFVVDKSTKFKENIVDSIGRKSHMATSSEVVLLFNP